MKSFLMFSTMVACGLAGASQTKAQSAVDTLTVEVIGHGLVAGVGHDCPIGDNGKIEAYVGTEIRCPVWVVDSSGARTPGHVNVEVADTSFVRAAVVGDTLLALEVIRKGNTHIRLYPTPSLLLAMVNWTRNSVDTIPPMEMDAGDTVQWCAYLGDSYAGARMVSDAGWAPACPTWGSGSLDTFPVLWVGGEDVLRWHDAPAGGGSDAVLARIDMPFQRLGLFAGN